MQFFSLLLFFLCFSAYTLDSISSARRIDAQVKSITQNLISSAEGGNAESAYQLALAHFHVDDRENGEKYIKIASEKGHEKAMYVYGAFFASQSETKSAIKWYNASAEQEYVPALHQQCLIYLYGGLHDTDGIEKDLTKAFEYCQQAVLSDKGSLRSQARLAHFYKEGIGVSRNTDIAYHLYLDAGQKGLYRAYSRLALDWHDRGGWDPDPDRYDTYWRLFKYNEDRCEGAQGGQGDYQCGGQHKWLYEVFLHFEQYM